MTATVFISLGSNVDAERNIRCAIDSMRAVFGELRLSPVYQSAAVGFKGDDFLNLVAAFDTDKSVEQVVNDIHKIEDELGRDRTQPRFSARSIDLDILLYDALVINQARIRIPRQEILRSAHVLKPLQDLIPDTLHPVITRSYAELWRELSATAPRLDVVEVNLD